MTCRLCCWSNLTRHRVKLETETILSSALLVGSVGGPNVSPTPGSNIIKIPLLRLNATQNWNNDWVHFGITNGLDTTNQNVQTIGCPAGISAENAEFIKFFESSKYQNKGNQWVLGYHADNNRGTFIYGQNYFPPYSLWTKGVRNGHFLIMILTSSSKAGGWCYT